jgi:hypothetical protein
LELDFGDQKGWNAESGGNGERVDEEETEMRGTDGMGVVNFVVGPWQGHGHERYCTTDAVGSMRAWRNLVNTTTSLALDEDW